MTPNSLPPPPASATREESAAKAVHSPADAARHGAERSERAVQLGSGPVDEAVAQLRPAVDDLPVGDVDQGEQNLGITADLDLRCQPERWSPRDRRRCDVERPVPVPSPEHGDHGFGHGGGHDRAWRNAAITLSCSAAVMSGYSGRQM
jgi:hypothetical protein